MHKGVRLGMSNLGATQSTICHFGHLVHQASASHILECKSASARGVAWGRVVAFLTSLSNTSEIRKHLLLG